MTYQIIEKGMYRHVLGTYRYVLFYDPEVCTRYILFSSSMYSKTYFFVEYVLKNIHFLLSLNLVHAGTYSRKKVCTEYILWKKNMYQVQTGLCPFIVVPYYSMVHTGMYQYVLGTYHCSRFQMYLRN